jgi:hypothetical protein
MEIRLSYTYDILWLLCYIPVVVYKEYKNLSYFVDSLCYVNNGCHHVRTQLKDIIRINYIILN